MRLVGSFNSFVQKVLETAKRGGLQKKDVVRLRNLLEDNGMRFSIMAASLISVFGRAGRSDTEKLADILQNAYRKSEDAKVVFTEKERVDIAAIFRRADISKKTEIWFEKRMNQFLAEELHERLTGRKRIEVTIPAKKTVTMMESGKSKGEKERMKA